MSNYKFLTRTIYLISFLLISEPLFKILLFKAHSGMPWEVVWSNIIENSHSFSRFFMFWILSPLAGVFLLTFSTLSYVLYFLLSSFRLYALLTYIPFSWPYFSAKPHGSSIVFELLNFALMIYLFYPIAQRFFLSRYLRKYWDARGRVECSLNAHLFIEEKENPIVCTIVNISSGGARVEVSNACQPQDGKLIFKSPTGEPIVVDFKLAAHIPKEIGVALGLEFIHLSPKEKLFLRTCFNDDDFKMAAQISS